jgi:xylan 1,4-beta-xylosidase
MVQFSVDINAGTSRFLHYWELCVGSCHAVMGLRQDWREQLAKSHRELGFKYVRFHGLLDDAMSVCVREINPFQPNAEPKIRYNFFNVDSVFEFLLSIDMKPFIELGFMPSALASGSTTCFHYKANVTPPADYEKWQNLIETLVRHLVERYGLDEVRTWLFEVWNEPNLRFFWDGTQEEYFKLYKYTVRAIKKVDDQLRVGGPATSINAWIPEMIEFCRNNQLPLDFVSTHHYPSDDPLWRNSHLTLEEFFAAFAHEYGKYERGVLYKMTAKTRQQAGDLPLYYTEWNSSAMLPDPLHDEAYAAALVAKTIADNDGLVNGYSFWTFSDLFEEQGQWAAPFHGGFGLQTIHGIPKPTYRVFEMLHHLGEQRLPVTGGDDSNVELLVVRGEHGLSLLAYNHNIPNGEIAMEEVEVTVKGVTADNTFTMTRIDQASANPKQRWIDLGSPEYPTATQLAEIEAASYPVSQALMAEPAADGCVLRFVLQPHGVTFITTDQLSSIY